MLAVKASILKRLSTPAGIAALSSQVGGCPRDIIRLLNNRKNYQADVESAVQHLKDICTPAAYMTYPPFSDKLFDLVLLQKSKPDSNPKDTDDDLASEDMQDDRTVLTIKGTLASGHLWRELSELQLDQVRSMFGNCKVTSPYAEVLSGYIFKHIALHLISGLSPSSRSLSLDRLMLMKKVSRDQGSLPYHFVCAFPHQVQSVRVDDLPQQSSLAGTSFQVPSLPGSPSRLPVIPRKIQRYERLDDLVSVTPDTCYVSVALDNTLFDAFFYEISPVDAGSSSDVVLWLFRTAVSNSHNGAAEGFGAVKALVDKAAAAQNDVKVKYVLVIPDYFDEAGVRWNMAREFDGTPGDVYMQFVGMSPDPMSY